MFKRKEDKPIEYNEMIGTTLENFYESNIGLLKTICFSAENKFKAEKAGIGFDELYSTGTMGLIHAYRNYNNSKVKLSSYLGNSINFYIRSLFIEEGNTMVKVPYDVRLLTRKIRREESCVDEWGNIHLSAEEISKKFEVSLFNAESALMCDKLDKDLKNAFLLSEEEGEDRVLSGHSLKTQKEVNDEIYIDQLIQVLTEREQFIVKKKLEGYNNTEISVMLNTTRQNIERIMKNRIQPQMAKVLKKEDIQVPEIKIKRRKRKKVFYQKTV